MNTKYLQTLKTILETGSFQKAAHELNYTQSTVTFQIQQIEQEFSIKLFEKIGRKMELTQIGRDILPYVDTILQATEEISNYGKSVSEISGTLKLAMPDSILIYTIQPLIQRFLHEAPNIQLIVNSFPADDIDDAIINGIADIGINCDKGTYPDTIVHQSANPFKACLVAAPFWSAEKLDFTTPHQRKNFSMVCNEPNSNYQKAINQYLADRDIILNPFMKMQSIEAVKRSVMNQLGIAYIPIFAIREELSNGSLTKIKTEMDDRFFTSIIVYHKNKWISPQMKLFLQIFEDRPDKIYE